MTLDEKLAQLGSFWAFEVLDQHAFDPAKAARILGQGIGQVTRAHGASDLSPREAAALANTIQRFLLEETRLGIPAIVHEECLHGIVGKGRVSYPQSIGLASTWSPELVGEMAHRIGRQLRAGGAHQALAPILDVTREPRWGRMEETFGEDAYLVAALGLEYVRRIQGGDDGWGPDAILATSKHLVGHGLPEGGFNHAPSHIGARELRDVFLFPFEVAVRLGSLHSVMHAYDDVDGIPCVASRELLTTILREEWGFDGIVVSDYAGIELLLRSHQVVSDLSDAAVMALEAGVDSDLPTTRSYGRPLAEALAAGKVDIATIDLAVRRILLAKVRLGLFERPFVDELEAGPSPTELGRDRELARELARRSIVVLQNDGVLPLAPAGGTIAVIGANADSARDLQGDYSYVAHVESLIEIRKRAHYAVLDVPDTFATTGLLDGRLTVLDAIRARVPAAVTVTHAWGTGHMDGTDEDIARAVETARSADLAILVVGERAGLIDDCQSGEARDRMDIGLPGRQAELVAAVAATGTPVILVLVAGRPLAIPREAALSAAVLHAWFPGDEGAAAIADILFGDAEPSGRSPVTVPWSVGQVPTYYGHKPSGGHSNWKGRYVDGPNLPLWPFGHGLSYTTFRVGEPRLDRTSVAAGGSVTLTVEVANTGTRPGAEVLQLYLRDVEASVTRPVKQLCGFARVELSPGQSRTVSFEVAVDQAAFTGVDGHLRIEPGRVELMVGRSSADIDHTVSFAIEGDVQVLERRKRFLSRVTIGPA